MTSPHDHAYIRRFFSVYSQEEKDKVRGHAFYPSDYLSALLPEGVAHSFVIRSPYAGAEFTKVDVEAGKKLPGVLAIITAKDIPHNISFGGSKKDSQLILANGRVRFKGEPVALVVAETLEQAKEAAKSVEIDWIPNEQGWIQEGENIRVEKGEKLNDGLKEVKTSFRFPSLHSRYLESESGWVSREGDQLNFHVGSLLSESQRLWLSEILGIPVSNIRAQETYLGGQFGGRQQRELIVFLALASFLTKRSCCLALEYEDQDIGSYGYSGELSIQYDPEAGRMRGLAGKVYIDAGSYEGNAGTILRRAMEHAACLYDFERIELDGKVVQTPTHPRRALKGEGITAITWVTEQLVDQVAKELGTPALDFRVAHCRSNHEAGLKVLEEAEKLERPFRLIQVDRNRPIWDAKAIDGRGFAFQSFRTYEKDSPSNVEVSIELQPSGSFVIRTSNMTLDLHMKNALSEVAASVLRTHPKAFTVEGQMRLEFDQPRKRETYPEFYYMANAVWQAADLLKNQLKKLGTEVLKCKQIDLQDGAIVDRETNRKMGYRELGFTHGRKELSVSFILSQAEQPHGCSAGAVSRVSFHPLTGELRVDAVKVVIDAGPIFYRTGLEIEAETAVAWAMAALFSSTIERDQPIPTPLDGPEDVSVFAIDYPMTSVADEAPRFFGARGVSDVLMSVVLASLVNAIQDAKEEGLQEIPMSPSFMYPERKSTLVHMIPFRR